MPYRALADGVLVAHAAFVVFVVLGGLLVLRWPRVAWLHVPAALWGAAIEFTGLVCPLTPLENRWRQLAGEQGYPGGFIEHYILSALYPGGLTREIQLTLGLLVVVLNLVIYAWVLRRTRARET
jgi:hypothetical protein